MAFMEPQLEYGTWIVIDGPAGTEAIPADLVGEVDAYHGALAPVPESISMYFENRQAWEIKQVEGWGCRWSAPGFMDCTPWTVFATQAEAEEYLAEQQEDDGEGTMLGAALMVRRPESKVQIRRKALKPIHTSRKTRP